jgi:hypothetical protein
VRLTESSALFHLSKLTDKLFLLIFLIYIAQCNKSVFQVCQVPQSVMKSGPV